MTRTTTETSVHRLPRYTPCSAWVTEADEARCKALWDEHVRQAVPGLGVRKEACVDG